MSKATAPKVFRRNCPLCGKDFLAQRKSSRTCLICQKTTKPKHPPADQLIGKPLSLRESQIAGMIAEGIANKEIAIKLYLTEGTVKVYISNIFKKTGFNNRTLVARWWILKSDKTSQPE